MISNLPNALMDLFDRQKHNLPPEQLQWLGKLSIEAHVQSAQLSESLQLLAEVIGNGGGISAPDDKALELILNSLSAKAENIAAMIRVSRDAERLANQIELSQGTNQGEVAK